MNRSNLLKKVLFSGLLIGLVAGIGLPYPVAFAWPTKDITFIQHNVPGGGYDIQSRIFSSVWRNYLPKKINIVMSNRPGAGGKIGVTAVMKSAPDGHTIGAINPAGLAMMYYEGGLEGLNIQKITWLCQLSQDPAAVVVSTASGIKSLQDLTEREMRFGMTIGGFFCNKLFSKALNMKARPIMFDGSAEEILAVMRGDVDIMIESWPTMKRSVENSQGRLAPLFILADRRVPQWPDVPCSKELNLNLSDIYPLSGPPRLVGAPAGIPADLFKAMEKTIWAALNDPEFKAKMEKANYPPLIARGADAAKTMATIMRVIEENKDILESLKKK